MIGFENTCAVVTGGASGIGAALAKALAARGAHVAIADVSEDAASTTAREIGNGARAYRCDISDRGNVEVMAAAVVHDFGGVNFVFANAGVMAMGKLTETDPREFAWMFDVNVGGTFNTIQAFLMPLQQQAARGGTARFILTGSENSVSLPAQGVLTAYTATKHAVLALADGLRRDLDGTGVAVSIFCPGAVNTRLMDARRTRQDKYGGPAPLAPEIAEATAKAMATVGQHPDITARLCLEGIANNEFMIITDPKIRPDAMKRHREVEAALDRLDVRFDAVRP